MNEEAQRVRCLAWAWGFEDDRDNASIALAIHDHPVPIGLFLPADLERVAGRAHNVNHLNRDCPQPDLAKSRA
jgi:hypothetical protein